MADKKISELTTITGANTASGDLFVIVDVDANETKKITRDELTNALELTDFDNIDINGGTIDGTVIGGASAAAGTFTTLNATGGGALTGTWTNLGTVSTIDINGGAIDSTTIGATTPSTGDFTTLTENDSPAVVQSDIGTDPNEIPLNQYLGSMAYQDSEYTTLDVGTGISTGTGTICEVHASNRAGIYMVRILVDLTGLNSGGTAGDIIGVDGESACYIARLPAMTVLGGRMTCLELPAGGDTDLDLYAANEGTGAEDAAITGLTETQIINAGTQALGTVTHFSAYPVANQYLYLVGQSTSDDTYTAGRFLIEIFGV